eukprot:g26703.t1
MLKRLGLTQPKARHLPLYVHARQLLVPGPGVEDEGSETEAPQHNVVSKPPRYFLHTLSKLGIQYPRELTGTGTQILQEPVTVTEDGA